MVERKVYASLQKGKDKLFMVEGFYRHLQKGNTELFMVERRSSTLLLRKSKAKTF
jgi:hypothetical protein